MREYKFRCWDTENKEMLKVQELDFEDTFYGGRLSIRTDQYNDYFDMEDMILMQYIGLKDKNGKEIYEGDILRYEGGGIYRVVFDEMMIMCPQDNIEEPSPGYYGILIGDKTKELCPLGVTQRLAKVIGNIHDNPELLGSEDKYD